VNNVELHLKEAFLPSHVMTSKKSYWQERFESFNRRLLHRQLFSASELFSAAETLQLDNLKWRRMPPGILLLHICIIKEKPADHRY